MNTGDQVFKMQNSHPRNSKKNALKVTFNQKSIMTRETAGMIKNKSRGTDSKQRKTTQEDNVEEDEVKYPRNESSRTAICPIRDKEEMRLASLQGGGKIIDKLQECQNTKKDSDISFKLYKKINADNLHESSRNVISSNEISKDIEVKNCALSSYINDHDEHRDVGNETVSYQHQVIVCKGKFCSQKKYSNVNETHHRKYDECHSGNAKNGTSICSVFFPLIRKTFRTKSKKGKELHDAKTEVVQYHPKGNEKNELEICKRKAQRDTQSLIASYSSNEITIKGNALQNHCNEPIYFKKSDLLHNSPQDLKSNEFELSVIHLGSCSQPMHVFPREKNSVETLPNANSCCKFMQTKSIFTHQSHLKQSNTSHSNEQNQANKRKAPLLGITTTFRNANLASNEIKFSSHSKGNLYADCSSKLDENIKKNRKNTGESKSRVVKVRRSKQSSKGCKSIQKKKTMSKVNVEDSIDLCNLDRAAQQANSPHVGNYMLHGSLTFSTHKNIEEARQIQSSSAKERFVHGTKVTIVDEQRKVLIVNLVPPETCDLIRRMVEEHTKLMDEKHGKNSEYSWRTLYTYTKMDLPCNEVKGMSSRITDHIMEDVRKIVGEIYGKKKEAQKLRARSWKEPHFLKYQKYEGEP